MRDSSSASSTTSTTTSLLIGWVVSTLIDNFQVVSKFYKGLSGHLKNTSMVTSTASTRHPVSWQQSLSWSLQIKTKVCTPWITVVVLVVLLLLCYEFKFNSKIAWERRLRLWSVLEVEVEYPDLLLLLVLIAWNFPTSTTGSPTPNWIKCWNSDSKTMLFPGHVLPCPHHVHIKVCCGHVVDMMWTWQNMSRK